MRFPSRLVLACLMLALAGGEPGHAQQIGSLVKPGPAELPSDAKTNPAAVRQAMMTFAQCVYKTEPKRAELYMASVPESREAGQLVDRMLTEECLYDGQITFSERVMRASFYELAYRAKFGRTDPVEVAGAGPIDYALGADMTNGRQAQAVALRQFADCTVRKDPASSARLLYTVVGGGDEAQAFRMISGNFSACLPQGRTIELQKLIVRGAIAEVLYRLRMAGKVAK